MVFSRTLPNSDAKMLLDAEVWINNLPGCCSKRTRARTWAHDIDDGTHRNPTQAMLKEAKAFGKSLSSFEKAVKKFETGSGK